MKTEPGPGGTFGKVVGVKASGMMFDPDHGHGHRHHHGLPRAVEGVRVREGARTVPVPVCVPVPVPEARAAGTVRARSTIPLRPTTAWQDASHATPA